MGNSLAEKFEQALEKLRPQVKDASQSYSLLEQVQIDALQSQLDDLRAEMKCKFAHFMGGNSHITWEIRPLSRTDIK